MKFRFRRCCAVLASALLIGACGSLPFEPDSMGYSHPITPGGLWLPGVQPLEMLAPQAEAIAVRQRELRAARLELDRFTQLARRVEVPQLPSQPEPLKRTLLQVDPLPEPVVKWERGSEPQLLKTVQPAKPARAKPAICGWRTQNGKTVAIPCR